MTDARLPGKWVTDPRMDELSDRAWRTFTGALMWSNEAGTDGLVPQKSLRFLHPLGVDSDTLIELVEAGLMEPADGGAVRVCDWVGVGQELAEVVEERKAQARERQRKFREDQKRKQLKRGSPKPVLSDEGRDVTRDVGPDVGQEQDRDRTGPDGDEEEREEPRVLEWTTAPIGEGRKAS